MNRTLVLQLTCSSLLALSPYLLLLPLALGMPLRLLTWAEPLHCLSPCTSCKYLLRVISASTEVFCTLKIYGKLRSIHSVNCARTYSRVTQRKYMY